MFQFIQFEYVYEKERWYIRLSYEMNEKEERTQHQRITTIVKQKETKKQRENKNRNKTNQVNTPQNCGFLMENSIAINSVLIYLLGYSLRLGFVGVAIVIQLIELN